MNRKNENGPGDKATQMRPERDATPFGAERGQPADHLQQQPVPEHGDGRYGDGRYDEAQEYEQVHVDARIKNDVRAHDTADCAGGADHRYGRARVSNDLRAGGAQSAQDVEDCEAYRAHRILDVVTEDPEKPHVAENVHPAAVHEHGRHHGDPVRLAVDPARHRCAGVDGVERAEQIGRDQTQAADRLAERRVHAEALQRAPDERVNDD